MAFGNASSWMGSCKSWVAMPLGWVVDKALGLFLDFGWAMISEDHEGGWIMHLLDHLVDDVSQHDVEFQDCSYMGASWLQHATWKLHCCTIYHTFNNAKAIGWALGTYLAMPLGWALNQALVWLLGRHAIGWGIGRFGSRCILAELPTELLVCGWVMLSEDHEFGWSMTLLHHLVDDVSHHKFEIQ
jgi:hypothetical protein